MTDDGLLELETLAEIQARVGMGANLSATLEGAGLTREQWFSAQEQWGDALAESLDGDASLFVRHELAMAEARERLAPKITPIDEDLEAWLGFEQGLRSTRDPARFVADAGLSMQELAGLHASWQRRLTDPELAARATALRASGELAVPTLRREPRLDPPRRAAPAPVPAAAEAPRSTSYLAPLPGDTPPARAPAPATPPSVSTPSAPAPSVRGGALPSYLRQPASSPAAPPPPPPPAPAAAPSAVASSKRPLEGTSLSMDLGAILRPATPFVAAAADAAPVKSAPAPRPTSSAPPSGHDPLNATTAFDASAVIAAALPFQRGAASASPAAPAPATPRPPAASKKVEPMRETTAFDASALLAAALPFQKDAAPAAPSSSPPAPPRASARPTPLAAMGETTAFDASALLAAALPFQKGAAPAAPSRSAAPVELNAYAAFVVEASAQREPLASLLLRHGLSSAQVQAAERYYAAETARDPALLSAWNAACAAHRSRLGLG